MAVQGTQVPMYTKHTLFLYFLIFQKKFYFIKKTKQAKKIKKCFKYDCKYVF